MYRYFINFAYKGTDYCGWQIQPNGISVQSVLEKALSTILRYPVPVTGAGRTDAGVHAKNMTAHFDTEAPIPDIGRFIANLNSFLPRNIAVNSILPVRADAHARFDALSRRYEYHVIFKKDPFSDDTACRLHTPLDVNAMNDAARMLFDYDDFTSFSKMHTDTKTNICKIMFAEWTRQDEKLIFTIEANRFLRNMVRAITGTMFLVGMGKITLDEFCKIIESKNRCNAGHSAAACGLYFIKATYPEDIYLVP